MTKEPKKRIMKRGADSIVKRGGEGVGRIMGETLSGPVIRDREKQCGGKKKGTKEKKPASKEKR